MRVKIKRRRKTIKTWHIFIAFLIVLILASTSYALYSRQLLINGTATGQRQQLDVFYMHIDNSSSYPSSVNYMDTFTYTFPTPYPTIEYITMGGVRLLINTDYTYTNGTLTIPNVTGTLLISGEEPVLEDFTIKYVYGDNVEFDGATKLDTDIPLFSTDNWDRKFEVTVNIDSSTYDSNQQNGLNTVINCVDHDNSPYHGFLIRRNASKYLFRRSNAQNTISETQYNINQLQSMHLTRENNKLYADVNNSGTSQEVGDYSNVTRRTNYTLFYGTDINGQSGIFRCFKGELSNMTVTLYYDGEEAPIILPTPTRTGYVFGGWYSDANFARIVGYGEDPFTPTGDTVLYAKWNEIQPIQNEEEEYVYAGQYNFAQNDYINTEVYLYTQQNIHRNFEMSFDIVDLGSSTTDDTLMSATNNIVKVTNAVNELLGMQVTGGNPNKTFDNIPNTITNIKLIRIDDKLYYSFNGQTFVQITDYSSSTSYSDNPVIFGADMRADGSIYRSFDGILANMSVKFISDNVTLADYQPTHGQLATVYSHSGNYVFDGTNNIDTNITLFNYDSYSKDFEISFDIVAVDSNNAGQASLVNSKYENQSAGYPGFVYRLTTDKSKIELTAAKASSGSIYSRAVRDINYVKISRRDMKIYIQINNEAERQVYDYSGFTDFFSTTVTIGSAKDASGNIFRPFKGTLANIVVKLEQ